MSQFDGIAALEQFIVENDDLLELEERIGRFNIFDALRVVDVEIRHSNFLAWLLDPAESHGQGALFLRAVLMDMLRTARENGFECPLSPIDLDGADLSGIEVRREWRQIDLLVTAREPSFAVAIENKVKSGESKGQLGRYLEVLKTDEALRERPRLCVFLTVEGDEPSETNWVPYSYADVHRVLERVRSTNASSIGDDVGTVLDHYLRVLRGRLMDDPKIAELCQRIYKNHRQALQLIYEHAGSPAAGIIASIESTIAEHPGAWHVVNRTSRRIDFVPEAWRQLLPPIGSRPTFDARDWIILRFELLAKKGFFGAVVCPTKDLELRKGAIERLTADQKEFGFRLFFKTTSERFSKIGRETIGKWSEDDGPDEEEVLSSVSKKLDELATRLDGVPAALGPLFG